jgi:hypothetical protein
VFGGSFTVVGAKADVSLGTGTLSLGAPTAASGPVGTNCWYVEDCSPRAHRYELCRGEDVIATGHLSRDQPLEVDDESRSASGELALRLSNHCCRGLASSHSVWWRPSSGAFSTRQELRIGATAGFWYHARASI